MMRRISKKINLRQREWQFKNLINLFMGAKERKETEALLEILLTPSEKQAIAQRVDVIRLINKGKKYYEIEGMLGVSPTTIADVLERYHKYGQHNKNFNIVFGNYKEEPKERIILDTSSRVHLSGSLRSIRKENEIRQKRIDLNANLAAIEEAEAAREIIATNNRRKKMK